MKIAGIFRERDPTQGSIVKNIFGMTAIPFWPNSLCFIGQGIVSLLWVSQLGTEAIAAVGIGIIVFMFLMALMQGVSNANYKLVGNLVGREDWIGLDKLVKEMLSMCLLFSLLFAPAGWFFAPGLLNLLGVEQGVSFLAVAYLRISLIGLFITAPYWVIINIIRTAKATVLAAIITVSTIALHVFFDYSLIFGNFGFPEMGVAGAALASVLSAGAGTLALIWLLAKGKPFKINLKRWKDFRVRPKTLKAITKVAGPNTFETIIRTIVGMFMFKIVAVWGTFAVAAYTIGIQYFGWSSMPGGDLGMTASIGVGRNLGEEKIKRAREWSWKTCFINVLIMGVAGLGFYLFAGQLVGFYNQIPEVLAIGVSYLKITTFAGLGYICFAAGIILRGAFLGAGNSKFSAVACFLAMTLQIGLALLFSQVLGWGINGVWWAILAGTTFYGLAMAVYFKIGYWKPKKTI